MYVCVCVTICILQNLFVGLGVLPHGVKGVQVLDNLHNGLHVAFGHRLVAREAVDTTQSLLQVAVDRDAQWLVLQLLWRWWWMILMGKLVINGISKYRHDVRVFLNIDMT